MNESYPPLLREIYDPPIGLYCKGPVRAGLKTVAIVGSRRTTLYGQKVAQKIAAELAQLGFCIISGMARGIDTAAHQGALSVGGQTIAVLGCGVDVVYPPENIDLYRQLGDEGCVMSEFSLGMRASKTTFPMRNRIVSGMSQAVIVVESDAQGGSMITARFAGEHNRHLFAVPGRIDQATSKGCHQLIKDGAVLFTDINDFLQELAYGGLQMDLQLEQDQAIEKPSVDDGWDKGLNEDEKAVLSCLLDGSIQGLDTIMEQSGLPIQAVSATLLMLEIKKKVSKRFDGTFELC